MPWTSLGETYDLERLWRVGRRGARGRHRPAADPAHARAAPRVADALTTDPDLAESPAADVLRAWTAAGGGGPAGRTGGRARLPTTRRKPLSAGRPARAGATTTPSTNCSPSTASTEQWLDNLADRERDRLGVAHLPVDRNKTDGYCLQVGRSETDAVPDYREVRPSRTPAATQPRTEPGGATVRVGEGAGTPSTACSVL